MYIAAASAGKTKVSTSKYAGLFGDSDDEDGGLFGPSTKATPPSAAVAR